MVRLMGTYWELVWQLLPVHKDAMWHTTTGEPEFSRQNSASETHGGSREEGGGRREKLPWGPHSEKQAEVNRKLLKVLLKVLRQDVGCSRSSLPPFLP